jgi:hypothetical protein
MTSHVSALAAATLLTASIALFAEPASTAPFSGALAIKKAAARDVGTVRWDGGGCRGRGWGAGWRGGCGGTGWSPYYGYSSGAPYGSVYGHSCWQWAPVPWGGYARAWVC